MVWSFFTGNYAAQGWAHCFLSGEGWWWHGKNMDLEFEDWCQRRNWFLPSSVILEESPASLSLSPHVQKQNNSTFCVQDFGRITWASGSEGGSCAKSNTEIWAACILFDVGNTSCPPFVSSSELSFSDLLYFRFCWEHTKTMWLPPMHRKISGIMTTFHICRTEQLTKCVPAHCLVRSSQQAQAVKVQEPWSLQWAVPLSIPLWREGFHGSRVDAGAELSVQKVKQRNSCQGLEVCSLAYWWHQLGWLIWCVNLTGPLGAQTGQTLFCVGLRRCFWMKSPLN